MTTTTWMDISGPIYTGMAHWPDNPPVVVEFMLHLERGDLCTVSTLSMGSHTGTHMDGPFHFLPEGKGLHEMPLGREQTGLGSSARPTSARLVAIGVLLSGGRYSQKVFF